MKVLVSDKLSDDGLAILSNATGIELDVKVGMDPEELKGVIGDYEAIIIRSATKLTKEALESATNLKAVVRAGVGVDNVDLEFAKEKGIAVMNTPGGATSAVAELAIGMMFGLCRRLTEADASMKAEKWEKKNLAGTQLLGKTLGIVGLGRIGRQLGEYARALGMKTIGYDPLIEGDVEGFEKVSLDEIYAKSDYISLHVPLTPETKHMIDDATIAKMKDGVRIINCARGGTVDEAALVRGLDSGKVAGAGFDVYETEPPEDFTAQKHPKVVATPHIGASTAEAQSSVSTEAADIIVNLAATGEFRNRLV